MELFAEILLALSAVFFGNKIIHDDRSRGTFNHGDSLRPGNQIDFPYMVFMIWGSFQCKIYGKGGWMESQTSSVETWNF